MPNPANLPSPTRVPSRLARLFFALLYIDKVRFKVSQLRWRFLKKNLHMAQDMDLAVGQNTIDHNLGAFSSNGAAFGMARRMSLLLFPLAALCKDRLHTTKVLIVGPRTEDDIFWAKSLGLYNTDGLDLFSYSPWIEVGDIHKSGIPSQSYDAVLLGWMISYSSEPGQVIDECRRILKPGGFLGIGIESDATQKARGVQPPRMNALNSPADLAELVKLPIAFSNELYEELTYDCGVVFKNSQRIS
ncbi:MAG: methyltransferase domain-containing protein [Alphaproteobacteria bacterium]|nr:methyltransferase domain-containing protein [Alphaproteobacteria bacterium]